MSDARKKLFDIAEDVQKPGTFYTLTENGKPKAVILSVEQYDSLIDDREVMSDPGLLNRIRQAEADYKQGRYVTLDQLKKELGYVEQQSFLLADRPTSPYAPKPKLSKKAKR